MLQFFVDFQPRKHLSDSFDQLEDPFANCNKVMRNLPQSLSDFIPTEQIASPNLEDEFQWCPNWTPNTSLRLDYNVDDA
jgi:hypothetical protein